MVLVAGGVELGREEEEVVVVAAAGAAGEAAMVWATMVCMPRRGTEDGSATSVKMVMRYRNSGR